ncbi:MAG: GAF domain-containing protein [Alysiella sp.]|uniref:GAF domain-containing protein n=1 Tax=Alysiella sp. TaxID=1872483 RepID=UPI0026DB8431|nr:GAF domain-containing protein [Alysiella sp.]MDO4433172.1 GAF domain-containing protein [Alysiella sp.]
MNVIPDYLNTQALRLNADETAVAYAAAQTVMQQGQAHIERAILFPEWLPETLLAQPEAETQSKRIFMALDSVYSREKMQSAAVYVLLPENNVLVCVAQQGLPLAHTLSIDDENAQHHLAARSAQTGWANVVDDTAKWLKNGDLFGAENVHTVAQMSLPLCHGDGRLYGVLHVEHHTPFSLAQQAVWVGLALALTEAVQQWLPRPNPDEH